MPLTFAFVRLAWLKLALVRSLAPTGRIGEVLAGEVHAREVAHIQLDPGQIVGLVAGRRVELGLRDARMKLAPRTSAPVRFAPVRSAPCRIEIRIGEVGLAEIGIGQRGVLEVRFREVGLAEVGRSAWRQKAPHW